jgi:serine/threonine-protein kinase
MADGTLPPLGDRYELSGRLGASPAAEVFRAHDRQLDRPVAVKVLSPELSRDPATVARFRRAATDAATLHGTNLVTVFDWGEDAGRAYVTMELVEGGSLADRLATSPRLPLEEVSGIGIGIADALDVAHRAGRVHGSLSPRDVLLARDGTVKVTDFGTAAAGFASAETTPLDAAVYDAPEQLRGEAATPSADLYALGTILAVAATGAPPFPGDAVTVTSRKLAEAAPPPSLVTPGLPPAFDAIVGRLLERDPQHRYPSAADVARDLARLRETMLVPAAAPTRQMAVAAPVTATALPTEPPSKRSATPWIVAAIVVLLLAVGALVVWAVTRDDDSKAEQVLVPAVVGQRVADASAALEDAGLSPSTVNEPNDEFALGLVFSQAPAAATKVRKGSVVVLKVSAGPTTTTTSSTSTTTTSTTTTTTTTSTTTTTLPPPTTPPTSP